MAKTLVLLETGQPGEVESALAARLPALMARQRQVAATLLRAAPDDFFYDPNSPYPRPQLVLEWLTAPGLPVSAVTGLLGNTLQGLPLSPTSLVFTMHARTFMNCSPQRFHYHYLMCRKKGFSTADYMDYYANYHSRMGFHTPTIAGYAQNDIDKSGSQSLAAELGLAWREVTSISELMFDSLEAFAAHPDLGAVAVPAAEDEERFVDRANSVSFCSEVVLRIGDFDTIGDPAFAQHSF